MSRSISSGAFSSQRCLIPSRFDLPLEARIEYLTLAVGNAKSHPVSVGGRHETAIAFLTDLEERLEVAQVQLELYTTLLPHVGDSPEVEKKTQALSSRLFTITPVCNSVSSWIRAQLNPILIVMARICGAFRSAHHQVVDLASIGAPRRYHRAANLEQDL